MTKKTEAILQFLVVFMIVLVVGGCSARSERVQEVAINEIQNLHDRQLSVGLMATCGAPLRTILQEFRGRPDRLYSLFVICEQRNSLKEIKHYMETIQFRSR